MAVGGRGGAAKGRLTELLLATGTASEDIWSVVTSRPVPLRALLSAVLALSGPSDRPHLLACPSSSCHTCKSRRATSATVDQARRTVGNPGLLSLFPGAGGGHFLHALPGATVGAKLPVLASCSRSVQKGRTGHALAGLHSVLMRRVPSPGGPCGVQRGEALYWLALGSPEAGCGGKQPPCFRPQKWTAQVPGARRDLLCPRPVSFPGEGAVQGPHTVLKPPPAISTQPPLGLPGHCPLSHTGPRTCFHSHSGPECPAS